MDPVVVDLPRPGVTRITLNRPDKLNAMTTELVQQLHHALDDVAVDPSCRVVVLTGAGRGFCAGLDLRGYGDAPDSEGFGRPQAGFAVQRHIARLIPHLRSLPQPVIAAVNGPAAGGGFALVLGSDIRIAATTARFNAAFIRIGLSACDIGISWLLPRLVGAARAHELMLTGRIFDAAEADRIGLVNRVVPDGELDKFVDEWAARLAAGPPIALAQSKRLLNNAVGITLEQALDEEGAAQTVNMSTEDTAEAVSAFLEKRDPTFQGR
jgi:enoyl-CoA hydratase